jgi:hypothetical protein
MRFTIAVTVFVLGATARTAVTGALLVDRKL